LKGTEMPEAIETDPALMKKLAAIRIAASLAMRIAGTPEEAAKRSAVPFVGFVSAAQDAHTLTGDTLRAGDFDLTGRVISNGQPHRALPLTVSLCMAVAARLEGSVVHEAARATDDGDAPIRIAMPSGVLVVGANVRRTNGAWHAEQGAFYRTQRRMFEGQVLVRASRVPQLLARGDAKRKVA
jgi:2-methylaconitate cis-trans-isomerase PrpF